MPKKEVKMSHVLDILEDFAGKLAETNEIIDAQYGVTDGLQDQIDDLTEVVGDLEDILNDLINSLRNI